MTESKQNTVLPPEEERFQVVLLGLVDNLISIVTYLTSRGHKIIDVGVLTFGKGIIKNIDKKVLIRNLFDRSHKYWDKILEKKESFFIENAKDVFSEFDSKDVSPFALLFTAKDTEGKQLVSEANRETIWKIVHSMTKISIKYAAKNKLMDASILAVHIKKWGVTTV